MKVNWGEVWDNGACRGAGYADKRQGAKAANDGEGLSAEAAAQAEGDMFSQAGVAAE